MMRISAFLILALPAFASAKTFQNSYVSFEVPDNWTCMQEGVAWTCTPQSQIQAKEAVIVLAAKVAGPEDNLVNFHTYLNTPKKLPTKVGTPMPSQVMYAQERALAGHKWIQAQHLGSEIQEFYTLYLATVKDSLAILVSFSAEKSRYKNYNPVFDRAMKTLKIVASKELLFPKNKLNTTTDVIGIMPGQAGGQDDMIPAPPPRKRFNLSYIILLLGVVAVAAALFVARGSKKRRK